MTNMINVKIIDHTQSTSEYDPKLDPGYIDPDSPFTPKNLCKKYQDTADTISSIMDKIQGLYRDLDSLDLDHLNNHIIEDLDTAYRRLHFAKMLALRNSVVQSEMMLRRR